MTVRRLLIACLPFLTSVLFADDAKPSLKLVDSTLRFVRSSSGSGSADLLVEADGFPAGKLPKGNPTVKALPSVPPPAIADPAFVKEISRTASGGVWLYSLPVSGTWQQGSVTRNLLLQFGDVSTAAQYTLTDKDSGSFAWSFPVQPTWNLVDSAVIEIPVVVKDVRATGIRILSSSLARSGAPALSIRKEDLDLCGNADGDCRPPADLGPSGSATLYLRVKGPSNGAYTGNVTIACDEKSEGDTIPLTVNLSTSAAQVFGIALVAAGVLLYYIVAVYARYKKSENTRLETALELRKELEKIGDAAMLQVANVGAPIRQCVADKIAQWRTHFQYDALHPYMPDLTDPNANLDEFKAYMQSEGLLVAAFNIVNQAGLAKIEQAWNIARALGREQAVSGAVTALMSIPDAKLSADDAKTRVTAALAALSHALGDIAFAAGVHADDVETQLQHVWLSTIRWNRAIVGVWFVISILTGSWAMVLSKSGFGAPSDYVLCLLWGFGLVAAGTHLDQLSSSDINSKSGVGIAFPKSGS